MQCLLFYRLEANGTRIILVRGLERKQYENVRERKTMGFVCESQNFLSRKTNSSLILNRGHLFICVVNIQYYIL